MGSAAKSLHSKKAQVCTQKLHGKQLLKGKKIVGSLRSIIFSPYLAAILIEILDYFSYIIKHLFYTWRNKVSSSTEQSPIASLCEGPRLWLHHSLAVLEK